METSHERREAAQETQTQMPAPPGDRMNDLLGSWRGARRHPIWPVLTELAVILALCWAAGRWGGTWLLGGRG